MKEDRLARLVAARCPFAPFRFAAESNSVSMPGVPWRSLTILAALSSDAVAKMLSTLQPTHTK